MPLKTHLEVAKYSNLSPRSGFSVQWPSYSLIVSTVSKYKKVKYHMCWTMDSGCFSELSWMELTGWTWWVGRGTSALPGAADCLEAVQIRLLFQHCVPSSMTGFWGVLAAELQQTVSQAEADIAWVALLSTHRGSRSNSAWQRNGRSQEESRSSWLRSCLQPSPSSSHRGTVVHAPRLLAKWIVTGQETGLNGQESVRVVPVITLLFTYWERS